MKKPLKTTLLLLILALPLLFYSLYKDRYEDEFAICVMFKDEAPYLKEWIDYHHQVLGASHFYLYNNDSSDNFREVLHPYVKEGLVELIEWKSCEENAIHSEGDGVHWIGYQRGAFNDCLKNRALGRAKWVAVIDIDEFIVPVEGVASFKKMLKKASKGRVGAIELNWLVFGTSNLWDVNSDELMTKQLVLRAPDNHAWHRHTKSIYRPEAVELCNIHNGLLTEEYKHKKPKISEFRIHHYWSGPEKKLREKRNVGLDHMQEFIDEFNVVEDRTILNYLPKNSLF
ncbi:MAG: hypothetical protein K1060chlam2_00008 [Chlamydiae bacterium]|nr:hypothetical protein [Chlamydiota bacterium]